MTHTTADVSVRDWLARFAEALAQPDAAGATELFEPGGYWRDLASATWSIVTLEGRDEIRAMLAEASPRDLPRNFVVEPGQTRAADGIVEGWFRFETERLRGRGHLRLVDGLCRTLFTSAVEIKGHEETTGARRERGVEHGAQRGRRTWPERRAAREAALGTTEQPYCLIIGGSQGGMALAARLNRLEVPTLVIDSLAKPGDAWRRRYRSLHLHDPIWACHMPYMPFPPHWPFYIPKDRMGDWLDAYAEMMEIASWGSTTATGAHYDAERETWSVEVERDGRPVTLHPRQLVLATGMSGAPASPRFPGAETFRGEQCHSSAFVSGAAYAGRKAVVVGSNNSAHDICADLWEHGAAVTMVQRSSTLVARADTLFRFITSKLFSEEAVAAGITTEQADFMAASRPYGMVAELQRRLYPEIRAHDAEFYARLEKAGFMLDFGEDDTGLSMKYLRRASGYYIDVGASELVASGEVALRSRVQVARLRPEGVELSDGSVLEADLVVYATGYEPMESWIAKLISAEVAERVGHVWGLGSGTRRDPGPWVGELRNMWKPTRQPGLWLQGGNLQQARFYSRILALQIQARMLGLPTPVHDPKGLRAA
ncbi:NAD(P)/FAD-dependent oxidoreductase [Neoroseomonas oryzicola]|uniref:NAD(P)/FAD-dependent oxidoreductase n=1 Tax=Neoroseomonas oryzicola TaxID=535904 RepID=A0A9X9WCB8_9PROT|nr:NAD(P)/FAD-dependent oxidoreductase [Neoroseomonas oryzicola]MBR0657978.1 NAD(P)/FAD-dependent oxidoreductase [Neoroseomonas oryzicola]NKE18704.1 NAD(P)/FAD-dependent oxidoreductase [Neoroseomonas oryzicola]